MTINKRLESLEKALAPEQGMIVRFSDGDGIYSEYEEDLREGRRVIVIYSPGESAETVRRWAE